MSKASVPAATSGLRSSPAASVVYGEVFTPEGIGDAVPAEGTLPDGAGVGAEGEGGVKSLGPSFT